MLIIKKYWVLERKQRVGVVERKQRVGVPNQTVGRQVKEVIKGLVW